MKNKKFALTALIATPFMLTQILGTNAAAFSTADARIEINETDLSSRRGVEKTYKRIAKAAENACSHPGRKSLREKAEAEACTTELIAQMVAQADSPQLSAYLENKSAYALARNE